MRCRERSSREKRSVSSGQRPWMDFGHGLLKAWPRLFHNLRASRETELLREHPIHVVTAWLGNSPRIALKHSCMITDHDFDRARGVVEKASTGAVERVRGAQQAEVESSRGAGSAENDGRLVEKGRHRIRHSRGRKCGTATARGGSRGFARSACKPFTDRHFRVVPRLIARRCETQKRRGRDSQNGFVRILPLRDRPPEEDGGIPNGEGGIRTRGPAFDRSRL